MYISSGMDGLIDDWRRPRQSDELHLGGGDMDPKRQFHYPLIGSLLKIALWPLGRMRLPQVKGSLSLKGLMEPAEVLRDHWGVAHIFARNSRDMVFSQGVVHAQDRLWQMDFTRRVVFGRLAEVLGEAALPADRAMRTMSLFRTAQKEAMEVSGELRILLEAYCAGVNAWIDFARTHGKLPLEFMLLRYTPEPWQVADTLGWGKLMCWTLAANWQAELYRSQILQRLGAEKMEEMEINIDQAWAVILDLGNALAGGKSVDTSQPYSGLHAGMGVGSNNWAVSGSRSVTGKPILANDMHLELTTPGIWYENHLVGGKFDVTGVTMPGAPMVIAGHNRTVAWAFTDSCPDTQDLYEEHLRRSGEHGWEYEYKGEWLPAEVRKEHIRIKGGKSIVEEVVVTHHGPIINILFRDAFPDVPPLALRWTALEPGTAFQGIYEMNLAEDCRSFREALRHFDDPSQNVVYADTQGNIAYSLNGRVPVRAKGDGTVPAPGWTGEYEWTGYVPFDEMPHLLNPPCNYLVTANNQVQRPDYPYFLGKDYLVSERAGRIIEMLNAREKVDMAYFQRMQYDQVAISARVMGRALAGLQVSDADLDSIIRQMDGWGGTLNADSPLACVFEATIRQAIRMLLEHHLGELGPRIQGKGPFCGQWPEHTWEWFIHLLDQPESPWFNLGKGENRDDVLCMALRAAVDFLKKELGPDFVKWKWGNIHQLTFGHVLGGQKPMDAIFNVGPFPIGGDGNTIWSAFTSFYDLEHRPMVGPPFRFIADLADLDHCWGLLVPGQSGNPYSRHFRDGVKPWFEGEYHPMLFRREEIEQNLEAKLELKP
jgi:penicillin amidase